MILEKLIVPLIANISDYEKELKRAESIAGTQSNSIASKLDLTSKTLLKDGALMTVGLTTPIVAFGKASVDASSDVSESLNKVQVVFGSLSKDVIKFSENSATALGMTQQQTLESAGTFGNLFTSMGLTQTQSTKMSTELVKLAADLASFNNLDPDDVLLKLRSGLVGEVEPLRSLGVNITAVATEAKAADLGFQDTSSNAAKVAARYALILDQTKNAANDFAETSGGLANQQRILKAEFGDVQAKLGEVLLPIMVDIGKQLIPLLQSLNDLDPSTKKTIVVILGLVAALGPLLTTIGGVIKVVTFLSGLFGSGGALATAGTFLTGTALPAIGTAIAAVGLPVIALIAAVGALIFVIKTFGKDALNTCNMIGGIFDATFKRIGWWLSDTFTPIWKGVSDAISKVVGWVKNLIDNLKKISIPKALTDLSKLLFPQSTITLNQNSLPQAYSNSSFINNNSANNVQNNNFNIDYDRLGLSVRDAFVAAGMGA